MSKKTERVRATMSLVAHGCKAGDEIEVTPQEARDLIQAGRAVPIAAKPKPAAVKPEPAAVKPAADEPSA